VHKRWVMASVVLCLACGACGSNGKNGGAQQTAAAGRMPCDDGQFVSYTTEFASGRINGDELVDICGVVTRVRAARTTRSGRHGYFYVRLPSGPEIEVVSNLDAMANASTGRPPAWPWVSVGDLVYVQGRYYYDSPRRHGIDWTEDDTGNSWPHVGWVAVCSSAGQACAKYW
jgi:hypothetical protein